MSPTTTTAPLHCLVRAGGDAPRPTTFTGVTSAHRIADLLRVLGERADARVLVDGRPAGSDAWVVTSLVCGSALDIGPPATGGDGSAVVLLRWRAGPDSGRTVELAPGRYVVGRAAGGPLRTADPAMAPHHAVVEVDGSGRVQVTDLGIGRPVGTDGPQDGRGRSGSDVAGVGTFTVGATVVDVGRPGSTGAARPSAAARPCDASTAPPPAVALDRGWTVPYVRSPRVLTARSDRPIDLPEPSPPPVAGVGVVGLLSLAVPLIGGVALAVVLRQPLLFLMVGLGALGGIVTWATQLVHGRRGRRGERRNRAVLLDAFADELERRWLAARRAAASGPSLLDATDRAVAASCLWQRRPDHGDAFVVALGVGDVDWDPPVEAGGRRLEADVAAIVDRFAVLPDATATIDVAEHRTIGIVGDEGAGAVARSVLVQLAVATGPVDWELLVVAPPERVDVWGWTSWLPHTAPADRPRPVLTDDLDEVVRWWRDERVAGDGRRLVVVVDGTAPLTARTAPLRRLLGVLGGAATLLVVTSARETLPAICETVVEVSPDGVLSVVVAGRLPVRGRATGCTVAVATDIAARLARWSDPELPACRTGLADAVSLPELLGTDALRPAEIARRWRDAGGDPRPVATLGRATDGHVEVDLVADGPHVLVAGTTGAGKSELLRTMVTSLALGSAPSALSFVLIDYKGGSAFDACAELPHVAGVVTDLDGRLAARVLRSLDAELRRREALLREAGAADLTEYRSNGAVPVGIARLVIVVDEFAALASELPDFLATLVGIAQRGRSLGVHLVLATQRPSGVLSDDIRANTNIRIALRVQDDHDALDVVGDVQPARFSRRAPGRAAIRLGVDELVVFQTARTTGPDDSTAPAPPLHVRAGGRGSAPADPPEMDAPTGDARTVLAVAVDAISRAATIAAAATGPAGRAGGESVHRPWRPPLGRTVPAGVLEPGGMALVDDPDRQDQRAHSWDPSSGHLLLAGALGSGTTTALVTVAGTLAARMSPNDLHLYVLDAGSDPLLSRLAVLDHVGAVVRSSETTRRRRLLHRLDRAIDERSRKGVVAPAIVVLVDGFTTLRSALLDLPDGSEAADLDRIVQDGPRFGVVVVATVDQPSAVPLALLSRSAERWVFRLADPIDAAVLGITPALAPGVGSPPGRCVVSSLGLEAQVAVRDPERHVEVPPTSARARARGPEAIPDRPDVLSTADLPSPSSSTGGPAGADAARPVELPIGVADASGAPVVLIVHDGEHVLVAGPPRSGRTTTLATIARQFRRQRPDGWVGVVPGHRSKSLLWHCELGPDADVVGDAPAVLAGLAGVGPDRPAILLVDDSDAIDDADGSLAGLLHSRRSGLVVVAAGRADALRASHGHWTSVVRRGRKGILLGAVGDLDGDLLGVLLPRGRPARSRPGDAIVVADGEIVAVQVAVAPAAVQPRPERRGGSADAGSTGQACFG